MRIEELLQTETGEDGIIVMLPHEPPDCMHSFYLYTCLVPEDWAGEKRDAVMRAMDDQYHVRCVIANKPVYLYRELLRSHTAGQSLPVSESIGERLFCVPIHPAMSDADNEYIAASLIESVALVR